jgi:phosphatidylglycerol lysyltransferase
MMTQIIRILKIFIGPFLLAVAIWVLHGELKTFHFQDALQSLHELPNQSILLCFLLTILSYLIMSGYDLLALRYIRHPLSYPKIGMASFIGYAFSNNIGLSMLAGGSVRYRLYSSWGLTAFEITEVVGFCTLSLWLGFFALGGVVFLLEPMPIPKALHVPFYSVKFVGILFLASVFTYVLLSLSKKNAFSIGEWEFYLPSPKLLASQILVAVFDWTLAGTTLFVLLPGSATLSWPWFISVYMLGQLMGLISQLPGGLGVFETVIIFLTSPVLPAHRVVAALLVYRGVYYFLPLLVAAGLLAGQEILQRKAGAQRVVQTFGHWASYLVPQILAFSSFVGGAILLFSGSTPAISWRLTWLRSFLPLGVIEISHFLGSLVGVALLLLARSLQRRVDVAYILTLCLLGAGIVFSLVKGFDYEEAIVLFLVFIALLPCRGQFRRKGSLVAQRFQPAWGVAIFLVLVCSMWLGFFSYRHIEYSSELWWQFTLNGDAPRFLRAMLGASAIVVFFTLAKLLRPVSPTQIHSRQQDLERVRRLVLSSPETSANLALLGDKSFLFSPEGNAFIMYGVEGRSWVSMGNPVGEEAEWTGLIWQFKEICDRYDGWPVFYEIGSLHLHLYLDLGLSFLKLGEEARVSLTGFGLEGGARKGLRNTYNRLQKEGCAFEILPPSSISDHLSELKDISNLWLSQKNTREKGFSLGSFSEEYLKQYSIAVALMNQKVVAFANIWIAAAKEEMSVDLMRYPPKAPAGIMDYLLIALMLHAKHEGYRWFNLGMAPLSGIEDRALAPLWSRMGAFVFRHGEHFYNLQGLRQYKAKFDPVWRPKYLACPGGLTVPRVLANIATLISSGVKGVLTK